ncbi:MAG: hypothetical protein Q4P30_06095, partial [Eubacteriales bacterium]|nr:hypothetical protein [Eubacteriales bacterium]
CVAQMLLWDRLGGIHFNKGCYPGQEVIARAHYRGGVKRGPALIHADSMLASGEAVMNEKGENVGIIMHSADDVSGSLNLAVIKYGTDKNLKSASGVWMHVMRIFYEEDASS